MNQTNFAIIIIGILIIGIVIGEYKVCTELNGNYSWAHGNGICKIGEK
jgi:hypothetical protein